MGLFSRTTSDELRAEAKEAEANIASATRLQAAFGANRPADHVDNVISGYQHTINEIHDELKRRA